MSSLIQTTSARKNWFHIPFSAGFVSMVFPADKEYFHFETSPFYVDKKHLSLSKEPSRQKIKDKQKPIK